MEMHRSEAKCNATWKHGQDSAKLDGRHRSGTNQWALGVLGHGASGSHCDPQKFSKGPVPRGLLF